MVYVKLIVVVMLAVVVALVVVLVVLDDVVVVVVVVFLGTVIVQKPDGKVGDKLGDVGVAPLPPLPFEGVLLLVAF